MGRRPLNTTKSGKFMNPTDQARKLARKKELKKNKKQRQLIRLAVLKSKDPKQILYEMEALDEMEFNTDKIPIFREAVLQDKRKKLREMLERVLGLYEKEEPEHFQEIKKLKREYEVRRVEKITYYESVKNAKNVNVDSIPLPENAGNLFSHDPTTDLSNMYYSFTNHHNMMLGLSTGSGTSYYDQPPTLYNIPLPHTANSAAYDGLGYDGQSTFQQHEQAAALLAMGGNGSGDVQQPLLKSILKPSIGNVFGHRAGPPGPPMDPAPPLSPVRTEERDQAERRLSRDLRDSKRRRRSRSPRRSRSGERSRSRSRERRRRRRDRESASPRRRSSSGSSSKSSVSGDSEKGGRKTKKQGSDTEEEFEEIIAEDKSYDEQASTEQKSRRIRFDGPDQDLYEEKDSRSMYKQLAKEIQSTRKQSRFNEEREEIRGQEASLGDAYYGQEINRQDTSLGAAFVDESDFYEAQQSMNYAMMQNSMMMKGFPMLPMQQTPYRPPINEPLLAPPPPPLFMQLKGQGSTDLSSAPLRSYGFDESNLGVSQIVGLPKLSYDRSVSGQPQYQAQPYFVGGKGSHTVIEAKPQIRSLTEESIKFMPTSLRVKRDAKAKKPIANKITPSNYAKQGESGAYNQQKASSSMTAAMVSSQTKDDAYAAFMKEMEEIM